MGHRETATLQDHPSFLHDVAWLDEDGQCWGDDALVVEYPPHNLEAWPQEVIHIQVIAGTLTEPRPGRDTPGPHIWATANRKDGSSVFAWYSNPGSVEQAHTWLRGLPAFDLTPAHFTGLLGFPGACDARPGETVFLPMVLQGEPWDPSIPVEPTTDAVLHARIARLQRVLLAYLTFVRLETGRFYLPGPKDTFLSPAEHDVLLETVNVLRAGGL